MIHFFLWHVSLSCCFFSRLQFLLLLWHKTRERNSKGYKDTSVQVSVEKRNFSCSLFFVHQRYNKRDNHHLLQNILKKNKWPVQNSSWRRLSSLKKSFISRSFRLHSILSLSPTTEEAVSLFFTLVQVEKRYTREIFHHQVKNKKKLSSFKKWEHHQETHDLHHHLKISFQQC